VQSFIITSVPFPRRRRSTGAGCQRAARYW